MGASLFNETMRRAGEDICCQGQSALFGSLVSEDWHQENGSIIDYFTKTFAAHTQNAAVRLAADSLAVYSKRI